MSDIFISYKKEDEVEVRTLAEFLSKAGWSVWWDRELRAGEIYDDVIEQELHAAKCVIVLWSRRSISSSYVKEEAKFAKDLGKLIPIAMDDVSPPFPFSRMHTLKLAAKGSQRLASLQHIKTEVEIAIGPLSSGQRPASDESEVHTTLVNDRAQPKKERQPAPKKRTEPEEQTSLLGFTSLHKDGFVKTSVKDIFIVRIYVNLLGRANDADIRVGEEIRIFSKKKNYSSHEIVNRRRNFFSGCFEYTVRFSR